MPRHSLLPHRLTVSSAQPPPDAERRQLTVLFCDLVGLDGALRRSSTPKTCGKWSVHINAACTEVIQRYEGHIAQLLGDGLLVYFGYPVAHEDDAHRAVRTGLGILDAMGDLNRGLQQAQRSPTGCPDRDSYRAGGCRRHGWSRTSGTVGAGRNTQYRCQDTRTGCAQYGCDQ